jgi:L-amino acid N-acyltransferase YncA
MLLSSTINENLRTRTLLQNLMDEADRRGRRGINAWIMRENNGIKTRSLFEYRL